MTLYWDGDEAPGFIVYALGGPEIQRPRGLPDFGWAFEPEVSPWTLKGERWKVDVWFVRVAGWPTQQEFRDSIRQVIGGLIDDGYSVAWIGMEGFFADPPSLFMPDAMSGGVLAACSRETGFLLAIDLDAPLQALTDSEMLRLREASLGFASAR